MRTNGRSLGSWCGMLIAISCLSCNELEPKPNVKTVMLAPVKPQHFQIQWCPNKETLSWTFSFGENPDQVVEGAPPHWPGHFNYQVQTNDGIGFAGGGGTSHRNRMLTTPHFWVHENEVKTKSPPQKISLRFHVPSQDQLNVEFELDAPPAHAKTECMDLNIRGVKQF